MSRARASILINYLKQFYGDKLAILPARPFWLGDVSQDVRKAKEKTEETKSFDRIVDKDKKQLDKIYKELNPPYISGDRNKRKKMLYKILKTYEQVAGQSIEQLLSTIQLSGYEDPKNKSIEAMNDYIYFLHSKLFAQLDFRLSFFNELAFFYAVLKRENIPIDSPKVVDRFNKFLQDRLLSKKTEKISSSRLELYANSKVTAPEYLQKHKDLKKAINTDKMATMAAKIKKSVTESSKKYTQLGRNTHNKEFILLINKLNEIKLSDPPDYDKYADQVLQIVEQAFIKAQKDFAKPFLSIGSPKTWPDFNKKVNTSKTTYHYPKLLARVLYDAYQKDPERKANVKNEEWYKSMCNIAEFEICKEKNVTKPELKPESGGKKLKS